MSPPPKVLAIAAASVPSALLFALYSRASWPWIVLGWVALVPWLLVLDRIHDWRRALLAGLVMAVAFELAVFGWFAFAMADYAGASPWVLLAIVTAASPLLQPQFVGVALVRTVVRRARPDAIAATALVSAAAYVAAESVTPKLFGDTLGYPLLGARWLRQAADIGGVPGLTFAIVAVNECVRAAFVAWRAAPVRRDAVARPLAAAAAVLAALAAYGAWRCAAFAPAPDAPTVMVGLVQANLAHYDRMAADVGRYATVRAILDVHTALSRPMLAQKDLALLVWPETVYPTTFGHPKSDVGDDFDREIVEFVAQAGVPLMFGSYDTDGTQEFNAALFLAPDAGGPRPFAIYRKHALFPLTERVPALFDSPWLRRALPWLGTWTEGAGANVVRVPLRGGGTLRVAPLICYDVLDPALARAAARAGAEAIVTLSNDSWFAFGPGAALHLQGAAFRSIETRRPQVRATNTGISAVIDATGTVTGSAATGVRATLVSTIVPERAATTLVVRFGQWIDGAAWLLLIGLLAWARRTR